MLKVEPQGFLYRLVAGVAGLAMISMGVAPFVAKGDLVYTNWFGELVFAPIVVLFGMFTIACAIFKPDCLAAKRAESQRRKP